MTDPRSAYAADMARLMHAVAGLTANGAAGSARLPPGQALPTLTCRDAVLRELQHLSASLRRAGTGRADRQSRTGRGGALPDALPELHDALAGLPVVTGPDRLSDIRALSGSSDPGPLAASWQDAARAAVTLEAQHDGVRTLTDPDTTRTIARDIAELAAALPYLDSDLAAALGPAHPARAVLLEPAPHTRLRLAAEQLRSQTADLTEPAAQPTARTFGAGRVQVRPLTGVVDLPRATRDLTDMLDRRGAQLTAQEARGTGRLLTAGAQLTARVLGSGLPGVEAGSALDRTAAVPHLQDALQHLPVFLHSRLATLTAPSSTVLALAGQATDRIGTLSKLLDTLQGASDGIRDTTGRAAPTGLEQLPALASEWAVHGAALAAQLRDGLSQAGAANQLLVPTPDTGQDTAGRYPWRPLPPAKAPTHPALTATASAAAALAHAVPSLTVLAGGRLGPRPEPQQQGEAAGRAALAELRGALQTRTLTPLPHLHRPAHPGGAGRGRT